MIETVAHGVTRLDVRCNSWDRIYNWAGGVAAIQEVGYNTSDSDDALSCSEQNEVL